MPLAHANDDECMLLIKLRREKAEAALEQILTDFGFNNTFPKVATVLDYLTNTVSCIELLLKILSSDWQTHNVKRMYEKVFGNAHPNSRLMDDIATAIRDQKYLLQPNGGLLAEIPELERLFRQLKQQLATIKDRYGVELKIEAPASFVAFLRDHAALYYSTKSRTISHPGMPPNTLDLRERLRALQEEHDRKLKTIQDRFDDHIKSGRPFTIYQGQWMMF